MTIRPGQSHIERASARSAFFRVAGRMMVSLPAAPGKSAQGCRMRGITTLHTRNQLPVDTGHQNFVEYHTEQQTERGKSEAGPN